MAHLRFKWRRGTAALWAQRNPVLLDGEPGLETDTNRVKVGDGIHAWNDLEYIIEPEPEGGLTEHINSGAPHPVYDDGPSLTLLYENAKV